MDIHTFTTLVGETPRQVRFLIAQGFMPPPTGGRSRAQYGDEHVEAVRRYRWLREQYSPQQIKLLMTTQGPNLRLPVAPGVELLLDLSLTGPNLNTAGIADRVQRLLADLPRPICSSDKDPADAA